MSQSKDIFMILRYEAWSMMDIDPLHLQLASIFDGEQEQHAVYSTCLYVRVYELSILSEGLVWQF
eukprot:1587160-Amphidinium_carterae.1